MSFSIKYINKFIPQCLSYKYQGKRVNIPKDFAASGERISIVLVLKRIAVLC